LLPVAKESLSQEEVADVAKLPFTSDSGNEKTEAARKIFKTALVGGLSSECDRFLKENNIPMSK
jgi:hypothetical protein